MHRTMIHWNKYICSRSAGAESEMFDINVGVKLSARFPTERLHNRLNRQAFLSPASINSMKSESSVDYSSDT